MKLAVADANIFIDLIYTKSTSYLFRLGYEIHTIADVIDELHENQQAVLERYRVKKALHVHHFSDEERNWHKAAPLSRNLSVTDTSLIFLAKQLQATMLTGDAVLRKHCLPFNLEVHGILWLLDRFGEKGLLTAEACVQKLSRLMNYNVRLPKEECNRLIQKWRRVG